MEYDKVLKLIERLHEKINSAIEACKIYVDTYKAERNELLAGKFKVYETTGGNDYEK